jgi:hypothetical protein
MRANALEAAPIFPRLAIASKMQRTASETVLVK